MTTARRLGINVMNVCELERYIEKYMSKKKSLEHDGNAANNDNEDLNKNDVSFNSSIIKKDGEIISMSQSLVKKSFEKYSNTKSWNFYYLLFIKKISEMFIKINLKQFIS